MKLTGLLLILLAAVSAGCSAAGRLRARAEQVRLLRLLLERICGELRANLPMIPDLLRTLAGQADFSCLVFLQDAAAHTEDFPACWTDALRKDRSLTDAARGILETAGRILGSLPLEEQLSALSLCQERLTELSAHYRETERQKGQLYRSLGLLSGLFAVILLL